MKRNTAERTEKKHAGAEVVRADSPWTGNQHLGCWRCQISCGADRHHFSATGGLVRDVKAGPQKETFPLANFFRPVKEDRLQELNPHPPPPPYKYAAVLSYLTVSRIAKYKVAKGPRLGSLTCKMQRYWG